MSQIKADIGLEWGGFQQSVRYVSHNVHKGCDLYTGNKTISGDKL